MSLMRSALLGALASLLPATGWAQDDDDRFFQPPAGSAGDEEAAEEESEWRGSLTSTTFGARETAGEAVPIEDGKQVAHESTLTRVFTDLRARLGNDDVAGMDVHGDLRLRLTSSELGLSNTPLQSGVFGGPEYHIRELYALREGDSTDYRVGRQVVGELAATRIDGVQLTHRASDTWRYLGFAGLYPARGSRSITTDYPLSRPSAGETGAPILPIAAGGGTAYRYDRVYGSLGVVGIVPLADDRETGERETPRVFATSSGYWRQSLELDLFHHVVVDGMGAGGAGLTNLHLGGNYRPVDDLRVSASVTRVDTETLNVIAQTQLEDRVQEDADQGLIQNQVQVARIAQESARLGVSAALADRRFEVSTIGALRRRPEVVLEQAQDAQATIPAAQAADVTLRAVDREFYWGLRLEGSLTEIFGVGANNLNRSRSRIVQLKASRPFADGRGELDVTASYLNSADEYRGDLCESIANFDKCYGTTALHAGTLGAVGFYRFGGSWMAVGGLEAGLQKQFTVDSELAELSQPPIVLTTGFARVAYRF